MSHVRLQAYDIVNKVFKNLSCDAQGLLGTTLTTEQLPASLGQKTTAESLSVTLSSDQTGLEVTLAESAKGQELKTGSLSVVLASDHENVNVQDVKTLYGGDEFHASDITLAGGSSTTASELNPKMKKVNIVYTDSNTSSTINVHVEVSAMGSVWHKWGLLTPSSGANNQFGLTTVRQANLTLDVEGWKYIRLHNPDGANSLSNVKCGIVGHF